MIDNNKKTQLALRFQIEILLKVSFWFGIGILAFALYRYYQGETLIASIQLFFSAFLLVNYTLLKRDNSYYYKYAVLFFIALFIYMMLSFFNVKDNSLNILWIAISPLFIYFFLDRYGGLLIYLILIIFVLYLYSIDYGYNMVEYITLIAVISTVSMLLYGYESYKSAYVKQLEEYNRNLEQEVAKKTLSLQEFNKRLQERVEEESSKRLNQEKMLLLQNRLAHVGQMLDAIAHQWRQPLMVINANLLNLHSDIIQNKSKESQLQRIDDIFNQTQYMSKTINDFRDILLKSRVELIAIDAVIKETLELLKGFLKGIDLEVDLQPCSLKVSKSEFSQVLIIIISNAIEVLKTKPSAYKKITISLEKKESVVLIIIEDNAGGIDKNIIEKIFEPYFSTKKSSGGSGLGLYIAKVIVVEYLNGTIGVENSSNGARFTITLPYT